MKDLKNAFIRPSVISQGKETFSNLVDLLGRFWASLGNQQTQHSFSKYSLNTYNVQTTIHNVCCTRCCKPSVDVDPYNLIGEKGHIHTWMVYRGIVREKYM